MSGVAARSPLEGGSSIRLHFAIAALVLASVAGAPVHADVKAGLEAYRAGDFDTALREFRTEAEAGDASAQYNLGVLYLSGKGVEKDASQAAKWHRHAAEQGLAMAQHGLGVLYHRGEGVAQDYRKAAAWFRKAADQGLARAQYNLGVMHFNGEGVEKNLVEVIKWMSLAAGQGFADAQFRLGVMYEQGTGLPRNRDEALKWFRAAAESGHGTASARANALAARGAAEARGVSRDADAAPATTPPEEGAKTPDASGTPPTAVPEKTAPEETGEAATDAAAIPPDGGLVTARSPLPELAPDAAAEKESANAVPSEPEGKADPPTPAADAGTVKPEGSPPPAATPERPAPPTGTWRVQLAAYRSPAVADVGWDRLRQRFLPVLKGYAPIIERVDLGPGHGVFHRVQVGPFATRADAAMLCARLLQIQPNQSCLPVRAHG